MAPSGYVIRTSLSVCRWYIFSASNMPVLYLSFMAYNPVANFGPVASFASPSGLANVAATIMGKQAVASTKT